MRQRIYLIVNYCCIYVGLSFHKTEENALRFIFDHLSPSSTTSSHNQEEEEEEEIMVSFDLVVGEDNIYHLTNISHPSISPPSTTTSSTSSSFSTCQYPECEEMVRELNNQNNNFSLFVIQMRKWLKNQF